MPVTGGSNIPALNYLLASWGIAFTDDAFEGDFSLGDHAMHYATGTSLGKFPKDGIVFRTTLLDLANEMLELEKVKRNSVPILGILQTSKPNDALNDISEEDETPDKETWRIQKGAGRIAVYGDSNCLDNSHLFKDCFWMLDALLEYTMNNHTPLVFSENAEAPVTSFADLPVRLENSNLHKHSKVIHQNVGVEQTRDLPACLELVPSVPEPLNVSSKNLNIHVGLKLLSQPEIVSAVKISAINQHSLSTDFIDVDESISFTSLYKHFVSKAFVVKHSTFWILAVLVIILFIYWYRTRHRPKRRRNRLRKVFMAAINSRLATV